MHLVTVAPSIPNPSTGGGGNWGASLIRYFVRVGHRVTHVAVIGKHASVGVDEEVLAAYKDLGVEVVIIPYQGGEPRNHRLASEFRTLFSPSVSDLWPSEARTAPLLMEAIERIRPDCVLPFAFDAVLYTDELRAVPRMAVQAEGPHINTYVNWRYDPLYEPALSPRYLAYSLKTLLLSKMQERHYARLTGRLTVAAFQGPHYVEWSRRKGLTNAVFVTTPTADPAGFTWRELRANSPHNAKCRILLIGHLHSTSNRSGLPIFFQGILPTLERDWGVENFEIHIVGRNDAMPKRYDSWRRHPALRFRGPVYPADQEFLTADILLVPIPARTGSRVRIINGFSFGCCVVAHSANALGIPELVHEENVLMADTGEGIAREVIRAAKDSDLRRRLGENGRQVYEKFYSEAVAGQQYLGLVEEAISRFHMTTH